VQASGLSGQSNSGAPEQDEDLHDDRQDFEDHADGDKDYPVEENIEDVTKLTGRKKKLWELRNKMVRLSLTHVLKLIGFKGKINSSIMITFVIIYKPFEIKLFVAV
jgi:pre-mRNA-splicing factor SYF2